VLLTAQSIAIGVGVSNELAGKVDRRIGEAMELLLRTETAADILQAVALFSKGVCMSEKNPAAVALGKSRWIGVSADDREKHAKMAAGSITRAAALARAKKAAKTRKRNAKLKKNRDSEKISGPEK